MRRLQSLFALALLALWLPATLHCEIEAAGLLAAAGCCDTDRHASPAADCSTDACEVAEGEFASTTFPIAGTAPVLCVVAFVFPDPPVKAVAAPPASGIIAAAAAPREINRSWIFAARAAPLPGAPAFAQL